MERLDGENVREMRELSCLMAPWRMPSYTGTRRRASVRRNSKSNAILIESTRMKNITSHRLVICIKNDDYSVSLETRKIYEAIPDIEAEKHKQIRIIDESGEDYLYPEEYFIPVSLPKDVEDAIIKAA
jgi:hypothetical protein